MNSAKQNTHAVKIFCLPSILKEPAFKCKLYRDLQNESSNIINGKQELVWVIGSYCRKDKTNHYTVSFI